jgi:hypothetical protein
MALAGESSIQETDLANRLIIPLLVSYYFHHNSQFLLVLEYFLLEVCSWVLSCRHGCTYSPSARLDAPQLSRLDGHFKRVRMDENVFIRGIVVKFVLKKTRWSQAVASRSTHESARTCQASLPGAYHTIEDRRY